jgi:ABC-type bacteriocin/lantibiotic exporter with double-glycine peptidase domain
MNTKGNILEINKLFIREKRECEASSRACVRSIIKYYHMNISIETSLLEKKGTITLADIATSIESFGLIAEGFQADSISNLKELKNPAIIPVLSENGGHDFGIYYGKYENKYLIGIPVWGLNLYSELEFEAMWDTRILLEVKRLE